MKTSFFAVIALALPLMAAHAQASQTRITCEFKPSRHQTLAISFSVTGLENPATASLVGANSEEWAENPTIKIQKKVRGVWTDAEAGMETEILKFGVLEYSAEKKTLSLSADDCGARGSLELSETGGFVAGHIWGQTDDGESDVATICTKAAE